MGLPATAADARRILDGVEKTAGTCRPAAARLLPQIATATAKLETALKQNRSTDLEAQAAAAETLTDAVARLADDYTVPLQLLLGVEKAMPADAARERTDCQRLKAELGREFKDLRAGLDALRRLLDQARKAIAASAAGERKLVAEWTNELSMWRGAAQRQAAALKALAALEQAGAKAARARDAAALKRAKDGAQRAAQGQDDTTRADVLAAAKRLLQYRPIESFGRDFQQRWARESRELEALAAALDKGSKDVAAARARIDALEAAAPDTGRAAKVLGLPAAHQRALDIALQSSQASIAKVTAELDKLARKAGLKTTGKEMVDRLQREKVL